MGQGDLEECEACGGSGEADRRYEKEGDEDHRELEIEEDEELRERGREKQKRKRKRDLERERERKRRENKNLFFFNNPSYFFNNPSYTELVWIQVCKKFCYLKSLMEWFFFWCFDGKI